MPTVYDRLCDLRIRLRDARLDNNEQRVHVVQAQIDIELDALNAARDERDER